MSSLWWSSWCWGGMRQALKTITFRPKLSSPVKKDSKSKSEMERQVCFQMTINASLMHMICMKCLTCHLHNLMSCNVIKGIIPGQVWGATKILNVWSCRKNIHFLSQNKLKPKLKFIKKIKYTYMIESSWLYNTHTDLTTHFIGWCQRKWERSDVSFSDLTYSTKPFRALLS